MSNNFDINIVSSVKLHLMQKKKKPIADQTVSPFSGIINITEIG